MMNEQRIIDYKRNNLKESEGEQLQRLKFCSCSEKICQRLRLYTVYMVTARRKKILTHQIDTEIYWFMWFLLLKASASSQDEIKLLSTLVHHFLEARMHFQDGLYCIYWINSCPN